MRKLLSTLFAALVFGVPAIAQMAGGPAPGPGGSFENGMEKLFSSTPVFSATMRTAINGPNGPMSVKAKMFFDHQNSRTEMNMTDVQGGGLPPSAVAQMQAIGMDKIVMITPSSKKNIYMVYPKIHSYAAVTMPPSDASGISMQTTKLGEETVAGHSCVKNKVVMTNNGQQNELTVWNATDLNNFPVQIVQSQQGMSATVTFENVSFGKLSSDLFQPPSNYTRYSSMQSLMESAVTSHQPGGPGPGPSTPPPNQ